MNYVQWTWVVGVSLVVVVSAAALVCDIVWGGSNDN